MRGSTRHLVAALVALFAASCGIETPESPNALARKCLIDSDCPIGQTCVGGICRVPGANQGDFDASIGPSFGDVSADGGASSTSGGAADAGIDGVANVDVASGDTGSSGGASGADAASTFDASSSSGTDATASSSGASTDTTGPVDTATSPCPSGCDDGLPCTVDTCDVTGACAHLPDGKSCLIDGKCIDAYAKGPTCMMCLPAQDPLKYSLTVGTACDDGNVCSTGDTCHASGDCFGTPSPGCCLSDIACATGSACLIGACDPGTHACVITKKPGCCTVDSECAKPQAACTVAFCGSNGCATKSAGNGELCDDGDACTTGDACSGGACTGGTPLACDDGNVCTTDSCAAGQCQHQTNPACCSAGACCNIGVGSAKNKGEQCGTTVRQTEYSCLGSIARRRVAYDGCDGTATTCSSAQANWYFGAWTTVQVCASTTTCVSTGTAYKCEPKATGSVDLKASFFQTSKTAYVPGEKAYVLSTITNGGTGAAGAFTVEYRLSTNTTLSTGDTLLGTVNKTSLAGGKNTTANMYVTIPATTKPGTYYVGLWIDRLNAVQETSTANNKGTYKITVATAPPKLPDLQPVSFKSTKTTYKAGETVVFTGSIRNAGTATAPTYNVEYRLSTNTTMSAADALLRSTTKPSLSASATTSAVTTGTIPPTTKPGTYYLLFGIDRANAIQESNEANNQASYKITVTDTAKPDLLATVFRSSKTAYKPGELAYITTTLKNQGTAPAGAFKVEYRLSTNTVLSTGDALLSTISKSSLGPNSQTSANTYVKIPTSTTPGTYYLGAWIDRAGTVAESDVTNNKATWKITVGTGTASKPDLLPVSFKTTKTVYKAGDSVVFTGSIRNGGTATAPPYTVEYRLSTNTIISLSDPLLRTAITKPSLSAGASTSALTSGKIPTTTKSGTYYIAIWLDRPGTVAETDEANNRAWYKVTVTGLAIK